MDDTFSNSTDLEMLSYLTAENDSTEDIQLNNLSSLLSSEPNSAPTRNKFFYTKSINIFDATRNKTRKVKSGKRNSFKKTDLKKTDLKSQWVCSFCEQKFPNKMTLQQHEEIHLSGKKSNLEDCDVTKANIPKEKKSLTSDNCESSTSSLEKNIATLKNLYPKLFSTVSGLSPIHLSLGSVPDVSCNSVLQNSCSVSATSTTNRHSQITESSHSVQEQSGSDESSNCIHNNPSQNNRHKVKGLTADFQCRQISDAAFKSVDKSLPLSKQPTVESTTIKPISPKKSFNRRQRKRSSNRKRISNFIKSQCEDITPNAYPHVMLEDGVVEQSSIVILRHKSESEESYNNKLKLVPGRSNGKKRQFSARKVIESLVDINSATNERKVEIDTLNSAEISELKTIFKTDIINVT